MFIICRKIKAQHDDWKGFKICLNQASNLNWACKELGERVVVFLDLEFWINKKDKIFIRKPHTKVIYLLLCLPTLQAQEFKGSSDPKQD